MSIVIQPDGNSAKSVFLAGTIDNGDSIDWQKDVIKKLSSKNYVIFNPRVTSWDPANSTNAEAMDKQIRWELRNMFNSNIIIFNFLDDSKSPISLLELGLVLGTFSSVKNRKRIYVVCSKKFYRYFNVLTTISAFKNDNINITLHNTLSEVLSKLS